MKRINTSSHDQFSLRYTNDRDVYFHHFVFGYGYHILMKIKKRFKKAMNSDNALDLVVDMSLILFDVLSSPILIVMRVIRYFFNKFVKDYVKRGLKWCINKI